MLSTTRQQQILEILHRDRSATVASLAKEVFASEPTIRRDLNILEQQGKVKRVYGGVILDFSPDQETPYNVRALQNIPAKIAMAKKASAYVKNGDVIFLDASSSAFQMISHLKQLNDIIVITSGLKTALALAENGIHVISTGGHVIPSSYSYSGSHAEACIRELRADVLFFSCRGLSNAGEMTDVSIEENNMRKAMFSRAKKKILLCDSSKFNKEYIYSLGMVDDIDVVISEI